MKRFLWLISIFFCSTIIGFCIGYDVYLMPNYREFGLDELNNIFINVFNFRKVNERNNVIDYEGQCDEGVVIARITVSSGNVVSIGFGIPKPDRILRGRVYIELENFITRKYGNPSMSVVDAFNQNNSTGEPHFVENALTLLEEEIIERGVYKSIWEIDRNFSIRLENNTFLYAIVYSFTNLYR